MEATTELVDRSRASFEGASSSKAETLSEDVELHNIQLREYRSLDMAEETRVGAMILEPYL
jgi:hypothetical protein